MKNGDKLPTEYELAEEFNASRVTVRRAIKELVDRNMAYKIQGGGTFVGSLDIQNHMDNFGVPFVTSFLNPAFGSIISGAENHLFQHSCYLTVHCSNQTPATERKIINRLMEKNVKSLIITPVRSNHNNDLFFDIIRQGVNVVFVDIYPEGVMANCVSCDNVSAGYIATKHMIDKGYKNIAIFCHRQECYTSTIGRESGYKFALRDAGLPVKNEYICRVDNLNDVPEEMERILALPVRPNAIFACNDVIAINLRFEALRHGLNVPDDLVIVGMDNSEAAALQPVPITSISQDFYRIGQAAAALCLEKHCKPQSDFVHRFIPVELIERESTNRSIIIPTPDF